MPLAQDKHPYEWVDDAIEIIQLSGIKHEVGPFTTVLEGTYDEVLLVVNQVNEFLYSKGCAEWITNVQIQFTKLFITCILERQGTGTRINKGAFSEPDR